MKSLLGTKIGMTQLFGDDGRMIPVTLIAVDPSVIIQVKEQEKDGYSAVQVGFGRTKQMAKPQKGHSKNRGTFRFFREFRGDVSGLEPGAQLDVSLFVQGDRVSVRGLSKGKGFAGVVKRHGFRGGWASHGAKHSLRQPGSIGSSWPERVRRGTRMAGRMGHVNVTVQNLEVAHVDLKNNLLALKGAVPGSRGTLLEIRSADKSEIRNPKSETNSNVRKQK